jgi:hypothetical protein
VEIVDDNKTRLSLNGEDSDGISSLAFRNFQGVDSYQGWLWEADISDLSNPQFALYDYDYLLGTPDNENRKELYHLSKNAGGFDEFYVHSWTGLAKFDNYLSLEGRGTGRTTLQMAPGTDEDILKTMTFETKYNPDIDRTVMELYFYDYDSTSQVNVFDPAPLYRATHYTGGLRENTFTGRVRVDGSDRGFDAGASLDLLLNTEGANHFIGVASSISGEDNAVYSLSETFIADDGGGASTNPLYQAISSPLASPVGLGGSHWFYGHLQTSALSVTDSPFSLFPHDPGSKIYINPEAESGLAGLHIDADNSNIAAIQVHNATGPALETLGEVEVLVNSTVAKPHLRLREEGTDFARLSFANDQDSGEWHIAGNAIDGQTGAADSRMNFYFRNNQGAANRMTITGDGKLGVRNTNPDEDLVVGDNMNSGWIIPAITASNATGGAIQVGNPTVTFSASASSIFDRTRLRSTDANGVGQGKIEMLTRQLNVGVNPGVDNTRGYALRVRQNTGATGGSYGMLLINGTDAAENWELYVSTTGASGNLGLYQNNDLRGIFDATSGNYSPTSDARLKTNISLLTGSLPKLLQLKPKNYNYKTNLERTYHGFLAQELRTVFPELVTETESRNGEETTLLVDYSQLTVLAISAIQEQQATIDEQATQLESQARQLSELEARLQKLEALLEK